MVKFRRRLNLVIILAFFMHGLIYYFFPQDLLNPESPIKWIKYLLVVLFYFVNVDRVSAARILVVTGFSIFFLILLYLANGFLQTNLSLLINKFIPYFFPIVLYLFVKIIREYNWPYIIKGIYIITSISGYIEFFVLQGIFIEFDLGNDGLRISTIFINPNNAALLIGLMNCVIISTSTYKKNLDYIISLVVVANSLVLIQLTGSKTGFVIIFLHFIYIFYNYFKLKRNYRFLNKKLLYFISLVFVLIISGVSCLLLFKASNVDTGVKTREISFETGEIRSQQIGDFIEDLSSNFLFPFYNKDGYTLDNTFVQFWGDFSFIGFIILFSLVFFSIIKLYFAKNSPILLFCYVIIILSGFSLNYLYVWPSAYIFWYLLFHSLEIPKLKGSYEII